MVFDYVARQKLSGTHMTYFILKQLACPTPDSLRAAGRLATGTQPSPTGYAPTSSNSPTPRGD